MINQKEAVFQAVTNVCGPSDTGAFTPTKEQRSSINQILFAGFQAGEIKYEGDVPEGADLKSYVSGLQSNWLRKDKRLNGNTTYVAKNPGSRAGSSDAQIVAMRMLLTTVDPTKKAQIQAFIDKRLAEIKPAKSVTIDVDALPEELKHLVK